MFKKNLTLLLLILSMNVVSAELLQLEGCQSRDGVSIGHFQKDSMKKTGKKILVFAQMHGDEPQAGELAQKWITRLEKISPSNTWRVLPLVNPDGTQLKTRMNANGVDLNRNFPTKDWEGIALKHWETKQKKDPRRFPGPHGGSEVETRCVMKHIDDFSPDIVVSIHTPYGQLDFDGPAHKKIKMKALPWMRLGTFPGSLGHYLWDERKTPVLTIELRVDSLKKHAHEFDYLQDQISFLAR